MPVIPTTLEVEARLDKSLRPYLKNKLKTQTDWDMVLMIELLPGKHEALSSIPCKGKREHCLVNTVGLPRTPRSPKSQGQCPGEGPIVFSWQDPLSQPCGGAFFQGAGLHCVYNPRQLMEWDHRVTNPRVEEGLCPWSFCPHQEYFRTKSGPILSRCQDLGWARSKQKMVSIQEPVSPWHPPDAR
jgi:hypothetical protein